ncbi:protein takeout-like [Ischnura elegans]|uniref:protein takeout-like n=1 Tax=Ischnura elegans TaxID=197161 RepID=UPI001ED89265|nr:protein takeout-like [Ischnura elegans]XP_046393244.1 protein takeout-like [Ischnura elegans]
MERQEILRLISRLLACFMTIFYLADNANALLPDYIKVCKKNDPKSNQCIINSIYELRPKLLKGIPELNVPSLEPLRIPQIKFSSGPQAAKFDATLSKITVHGPGNFIIRELRADLTRNVFDFKLLLPHLHFEGEYKLDVNILLLPIRGNGKISGNFTQYAADVHMPGKKIKKDGEEYLELEKMQMKINVGKTEISLSNLFDGDPILGPATNRIINENSKIFLEEISPVLEDTLADLFTAIANRITLTFTYKELFPEK